MPLTTEQRERYDSMIISIRAIEGANLPFRLDIPGDVVLAVADHLTACEALLRERRSVPTDAEIRTAFFTWGQVFRVASMSQEDAFAAGYRFGVVRRDSEWERSSAALLPPAEAPQ